MGNLIGYQILLKLKSTNRLTCQELSSELKTTNSKVRNEINYLNQIMNKKVAQIDMKRGKGNGYSLNIFDSEKFDEFIEKYRNDSYQESQLMNHPMRRVENILFRLLNSNGSIKLKDLADEIGISERQMNNDLKAVRGFLDDYLLKIVNRPYYGMQIEGSEFNKRLCLANLYLKNISESGDSFISEDNQFNKEINQIREIVLDEAFKANIEFSDIALENLIVHIYVMISRVDCNYDDDTYFSEKIYLSEHEYSLSKEILKRIEKLYSISFNEYDFRYLEVHIAGKRVYVSDDMHKISDEARKLTYDILEEIDENYHTALRNDEQLIMRLCLHFTPLLIRLKNNIASKNPMLEDIQTRYTLSNEMAVLAGKVINRKYNVQITQDEISYISLHFELSAYQLKMQRYKVLLICHTGKSSSEILRQQILFRFGNYIETIDTCSVNQVSKIDLDSYTFILSTIPIKLFTRASVYVIDTFLDDKNSKHISSIFKLGDFARNNMTKFFPEDLFVVSLDTTTREETVKELVEVIKKKRVVSDNFYDSIMERERLSSTDYGNLVAIPHPMVQCSDDTFTSVAILNKPIKWNNNMVSLVFLNCVNNHSEDLKPFYYLLTKFISDSQKVNQLLQNPTYENLITLIHDNHS